MFKEIMDGFCGLFQLNKIFPRLMAGVQETFMTYEIYDDDITLRLVQEACKMLGEYHFVLRSTNHRMPMYPVSARHF